MRGATLPLPRGHRVFGVSIRAPVRGATANRLQPPSNAPGFDPRPRAGSDLHPVPDRRGWRFRSAPPCGERRRDIRRLRMRICVSIRAPVRGATHHGTCHPSQSGVSIRAPVRGATIIDHIHPRIERVSIRAPVRGATGRGETSPPLIVLGFDPRPRAGSDMLTAPECSTLSLFRSAPPCGERHAHRAGVLDLVLVSIRAPVRGATTSSNGRSEFMIVSIRAPVRGATIHGGSRPPHAIVSIRAPVRGATP